MSEQFILGFKRWDATYGKLAVWLWRLILYPLAFLGIYAGSAYLDSHYVPKPYFDKAMAVLAEDKSHYATEQRQELKEINSKLDALLLRDSANSQRFTDAERRLSRLEDKYDKAR